MESGNTEDMKATEDFPQKDHISELARGCSMHTSLAFCKMRELTTGSIESVFMLQR